jgi:hypothetical protein
MRLHGLLRAAAEPWLKSSVEPVIIGWYQYRTKHANDDAFGMFRLQYGARAWSTGAHSVGGSTGPIVPKYQVQFDAKESQMGSPKREFIESGATER